jgi:hypothetical protein
VTDAQLFAVSVLGGAALLAVWVELRWPSLAPERLGHRVLALGLGFAALNLGPLGFERALGLPIGQPASALLAALVLLVSFTVAFVTAVWLLRSLQSLGAMR